MKKFFATALALMMLIPFAACVKPAEDTDGLGLTEKESERILDLAHTFRVFGEFDISKGVDMKSYETFIYCLYTWKLAEVERGYGTVSVEEADRALKSLLGSGMDTTALVRTKHKPNEVQLIYFAGDSYYILLTDDSAYKYEITSASIEKDGSGEKTSVTAMVKVTGEASSFSLELKLVYGSDDIFYINKCVMQNYE